jgi:hypothetical protein
MYTLAPVGVDMVASGGGEKQMRSINPFKNSDVQACPNKVTWRNAITFLVCFAVPYLGHLLTPASPFFKAPSHLLHPWLPWISTVNSCQHCGSTELFIRAESRLQQGIHANLPEIWPRIHR